MFASLEAGGPLVEVVSRVENAYNSSCCYTLSSWCFLALSGLRFHRDCEGSNWNLFQDINGKRFSCEEIEKLDQGCGHMCGITKHCHLAWMLFLFLLRRVSLRWIWLFASFLSPTERQGPGGGSKISGAPWPPNTFPSSAAWPGVASLGAPFHKRVCDLAALYLRANEGVSVSARRRMLSSMAFLLLYMMDDGVSSLQHNFHISQIIFSSSLHFFQPFMHGSVGLQWSFIWSSCRVCAWAGLAEEKSRNDTMRWEEAGAGGRWSCLWYCALVADCGAGQRSFGPRMGAVTGCGFLWPHSPRLDLLPSKTSPRKTSYSSFFATFW